MITILKALADETRLRILAQLFNDHMCVCEIEQCLGLTQSNASRHLTILKNAGILDGYKKAQWVYYKLSDQFMNEHTQLYEYVKSKLMDIDGYNNDFENYKSCKQKDLCQCEK